MLFVDHVLRSMAQYIYGTSLLSYPVLPLKSYPMVVKTLEADQQSRMVAEPQLVSDLTRHQNSAI
jgi:hypothetical protein